MSVRPLAGTMTALPLVALLVITRPTQADITVVPATADATLYQDSDGLLANGAGDYLFAGATDSANLRRGIIRFDVGACVPTGSLVTSATLTLHMSRTNTGPQAVSLQRVLAPWTEGSTDAPGEEGAGWPSEPGDVTWIHRTSPDEFWDTAGGDFEPGESATVLIGGNGFYEWTGALLAADVLAWIDNPDANFGWMLIGDESFAPTAKRFDSRSHPDAGVRPTLRIEYTPVPAPGALGMFLAPATKLVRRRRSAPHGGVP